jgi:hypothetical protein
MPESQFPNLKRKIVRGVAAAAIVAGTALGGQVHTKADNPPPTPTETVNPPQNSTEIDG